MNNFCDYRFSDQKDGEEILLVVRRHWFDILKQFTVVFAMVALLVGSFFIFPLFFPTLAAREEDSIKALFLFAENIFAMMIWITFFLIWIDYYFDVWIVTNLRVVNVEQRGLFSRNVSELELERVQDVTTEVRGVIPTFLNYGDVFVQTAGERERFQFRQVPDPYYIKDMVMKLQDKQEKAEANELGEIIRRKMNV